MCLVNATSQHLWQSFNAAVLSVEACWAYNPCTGSYPCHWCATGLPTLAPTQSPSQVLPPSVSASPTALPTPVTAGDIAVVVYNTANPDAFACVALVHISNGTKVMWLQVLVGVVMLNNGSFRSDFLH